MAFKTTNDRRYYIIPKHGKKGLVLGVDNENMWAHVKMMKIDTSSHRKFRFEKWGQGFFIKIGDHSRYAIVHNRESGSHTDQKPAPIIQGEMAGDSNPMGFRLLPAGGGYYRIQNLDGGRYWDVYGIKDEENADVVQVDYTGTENQLFSIVPVPNDKIEKALPSLIETTDLIRVGVIGVVGMIPEVGRALGTIIGFFWKDTTLSDMWSQMQSYVEARIKSALLEKTLDEMKREIKGELEKINKIKTDPSPLKGDALKNEYLTLLGISKNYEDRPAEALPYLLNFGTIYITVCRTLLVSYKELFGKEPTADEKKFYQDNLTQAIGFMREQTKQMREELIRRRMQTVTCSITGSSSQSSTTNRGVAEDSYDGWRQSWSYTTGRTTYGTRDYETRANEVHKNRVQQARVQFESEMEVLLQPLNLWHDMNPQNTALQKATIRKEVNDFGGPYAHNPFAAVTSGRLTKVKIFTSDGRLCGIEMFHDGKSQGVKGSAGNASELELANDEYISSVWGFGQNQVDGIWFSTNKGKVAGGGATHVGNLSNEHYFCGDLADALSAKLIGISGAWNGGTLERIGFTWEYSGYPAPLGYKFKINEAVAAEEEEVVAEEEQGI
jgi:hypothetical protein